MAEIKVYLAGDKNLDVVRGIHQDAELMRHIGGNEQVFIAVDRGAVIGTARLSAVADALVLDRLAASPPSRIWEAGHELLRHLCDQVIDQDCYCLAASTPLGLYESFNFLELGKNLVPPWLRAIAEASWATAAQCPVLWRQATRPVRREEFLRDPFGAYYQLDRGIDTVPVDWLKEAWKNRDFRVLAFNILCESIRHTGTLNDASIWLKVLPEVLDCAQVRGLFIDIRDSVRWAEEQWRPQFEAAFRDCVHTLPPRALGTANGTAREDGNGDAAS